MNFREFFFLPIVASSHGQEIDMVIYLVHILMFILFAGWGTYVIYTLCRFAKPFHPKASYTGLESHITSKIEVAVVIFEAVLLIGFSIPFWIKQVNNYPDRPDRHEVRVIAEQFAWNVHYPGTDKIFGKTDFKYFDKQSNPLGIDPNDPHGKDDITTINQLYLPAGRPAIIHLTSKDVIHSFFLPEMRVKQDAIPGMSIPTWFTPTKLGKYEIACAQLCGIGHYSMRGFMTIQRPEEFDKWIAQQSAQASDPAAGGFDDFWN